MTLSSGPAVAPGAGASRAPQGRAWHHRPSSARSWPPSGELTPQQRQIVRLASDGLTDREIGDRLFLSPRTVSSHLYRSYPKLGVATRYQLRDVIARASTPATAHEGTADETLS